MTYGQIQQAYFEGREAEVKAYFDTLKDSGEVWVQRDIAFTWIHELIKDFKANPKYKHNYPLQKKVGIVKQQTKWHGSDEDSTLGVLAKMRYLATIQLTVSDDYYLIDSKYSQPKQ